MSAERDPEQNTADNAPRGLYTSGVPQLESTPGQAEAVMNAAIKLQIGQNEDDGTWLAKLDLPRHVEDEIWLRLVSRGGEWLELVRQLSGFKGRLGDLRDRTL